MRIYFSLADMDGDGIQELVFSCYYLVTQILHYEDGKVYCYQLETDSWDTDVIMKDGVFKTGYGTISFRKRQWLNGWNRSKRL